MKAKKAFTTISLLAVMILSVTFASAQVLTISNLNKPTSVNENSGSYTFTFDVTYTGNSSSGITINMSHSSANFGTLSFSNPGTFNASQTKTVTGTATGYSNQGGNNMQVTLNLTASTSPNNHITQLFTVPINNDPSENFCPAEVGDLEISDFNINNFGEGDDEEWQPLDRIEIEVEIENTNRTEDVDDVMVEIKIVDDNGNDVTNDFELEDEEIDLGRIRDDDAEIATFVIEEIPADLEEGKYRLFIKAYSDGEEELQCVSESRDFSEDNYHEIEFLREDDEAVVVRTEDLRQDVQAICGEQNVQVTFPVYNLGTDKEEKVLVNLYNRDLGIDEYELVDNLRSGKRKEVSFMIDIPENAYEESYDLEIFTHFDYDEDEDEMDESSYDLNSRDDLDKEFKKELVIVSCEAPSPSITANLASEADVGSDMVVRVRITNNGNQDQLYTVDAIGYESWADLKEITPRTITIDAGETEEITVTLVPTQSGLNSFRLVTNAGGQDYSQPVSVNVAGESENESETSGALGELFENKLLTYVVIGIAVLIILILIVLIGRLSSSSRRAKAE